LNLKTYLGNVIFTIHLIRNPYYIEKTNLFNDRSLVFFVS
jgi:hypothetical protein